MRIFCILLALTICGLTTALGPTSNRTSRAQIDVAYYYTLNNDQDGDFIVSQLIPEITNPNAGNTFFFLALPFGGVQILKVPEGTGFKYYCTGADSICETSLVHYCVEFQDNAIYLSFLKCYFENELYPNDPLGASQNCVTKYTNAAEWDKILTCSKQESTLSQYADSLLIAQALRPAFEKTPHVLLNEKYSALAAIDMKKALCRVQATDIWQCESIDRWKEPVVEIFYSVYDQEASDFFLTQYTKEVSDSVQNTASEVDVFPNPNKLSCDPKADDGCWSFHAHWCIYENFAAATQLQIIQCTFNQTAGTSEQDRIANCVPDANEINNCVNQGIGPATAINRLKTRFNLLVDQQQQQPLEIIIKGQSSMKAKNGILQEICNNFFEIDDETLGCRVATRPKVQVFYESQSAATNAAFGHLMYYGQLAPFETIAQFEFIPYGSTTYDAAGPSYTCKEGEKQCEANWLQACVIKQRYKTLDDQFQFFRFISCAISVTSDPVKNTEECIRLVYSDGENFLTALRQCAQTDSALKEQLRTKTEAIGFEAAPEIVVDGVKKTTEMGNTMLVNLCRSFESIKPKACFAIDTDSSQSVLASVYLTGDEASKSFVQSVIKPIVTEEPRDLSLRLRDVIEWQFIPWGPSQYNSSTGEIQCANGDEECIANRVLACATKQRQTGLWPLREDKQRVAAFVVCFFDSTNWNTNPLQAASECAPKLSSLDIFPQLWQCALQDVKLQVLLDMQKITANNYPPIAKFPEVAINLQRISNANDLVKATCGAYNANPRPVDCPLIEDTTPTPGGGAISTSASAIMLLCALALARLFGNRV